LNLLNPNPYRKADTLTAGFVDQPKINPQPAGIFEMGDKDANAPFFLRLVQWRVKLLLSLTRVIKWGTLIKL
jgi:hypothetical protein